MTYATFTVALLAFVVIAQRIRACTIEDEIRRLRFISNGLWRENTRLQAQNIEIVTLGENLVTELDALEARNAYLESEACHYHALVAVSMMNGMAIELHRKYQGVDNVP